VLVRLGEEYAAAARCREAVAVLQRALAVEPLHEEAHRAIMACYLEHGEAGRAIAQYEHLAALLRAELGVEPDPATQALYRRARRMAGAE
jgi:DNA-binding SARP family transcriptional activator